MNVRNRLLTILALVLSTSCMVEKGEVNIKLPGAKNFRHSEITKATVTNVQIINDQLVITGTNLNVVTNIKTENASKSFSESFTIESKTSSQIIANSNSPLSFAVNSLFNLVLSNSYGAATFQINFSLCDATINGKGINCSVVANDKDVLSYDSVSDTWRPRQVNGLNYLGTFDASPGIAPTVQPSGSYYVISVSGTIGAINFDVGDWIVSNGSAYQKIDNSTAIISVFGRTGAVTGAEGDYSLDLLSDVDLLTTPPTAGKILKYNGTQWVVSDDLSSGGAGSVSSSEIADGTIATADLANASVTDAKINSVAASKITGTVNGSQIGAGVITNSHIAAGAAIDYSKLNITNNTIPYAHINVGAGEIAQDRIAGFSTALANLLTGTITNGDTTHAPTGDAVFDALGLKLNLTGGTLTMGTINGVPTPVNGDDIVNKAYVDSAVTGATTTANDKVSKTGDTMTGALVLPSNGLTVGTNQLTVNGGNVGIGTTTPQAKLDVLGSVRLGDDVTACSGTNAGAMKFVTNTVYYCNGSTWTAFSNSGAAVSSTEITDGSIVNADINAAANIAQSKIAGLTTDLSNKQPLDTGLTNLAAFNSNGILVQSADNTFVGRSIAGTANRLDVTNGDGVSGNPTLNINPTLLPSPTVGGYFLKSTGADASAWSALTNGEITTALGFTPVDKSGDTISTGTITFNAIGTLALGYTPTNLTDATSKSYVDNLVATAANQWTESSGNIYRNSGNVGIGTTSPSSKLHIFGSQIIESSPGGSSDIVFKDTSSPEATDRNWIIRSHAGIGGARDRNLMIEALSGGNLELLPSGGNVGIGTTSPQTSLHINSASGNSVVRMTAPEGSGAGIQVGTNNGYWFGTSGDSANLIINRDAPLGTGQGTLMAITPSGNVGIGTTAPNTKLELAVNTSQAVNQTTLFTLKNASGDYDGNNGPAIEFANNIGLAKIAGVDERAHGADEYRGALVFKTRKHIAGTDSGYYERMRINYLGNLGIGTSTPSIYQHGGTVLVTEMYNSGTAASSQSQFIVSSGSTAANSAIGGITAALPNSTATNKGVGYAAFSTGTASTAANPSSNYIIATRDITDTNWVERMRVAENGNVGIGTSAPNRKLDVNDPTANTFVSVNSSTTTAAGIIFGDTDADDRGQVRYENNGDYMAFYTASSEKARLTNTGALGIGTSSPGTLLDVNGVARAVTYTFPAPVGDPAPVITARTVPVGQGSANEKTELILFHSNDPANASGNDQITLRAPALSFQTYNDPTVADINNNNGYNERMYITPTGNVGIGTTSPSRTLYVNGTSGGSNAWENLSDKRLKRDIATVDNALEKILQIDGVEYFWNKDAHSLFNVSKRKELGVIAQDVEKQFPEVVKTDDKGIKSVAYTMLISPMIEAIKSLYYDHIEVLWKNVNEHERNIASLKNENHQIKKDLDQMKKENRELRSAICEINPKSKVCR